MYKTNLRKVGGSVMLALPRAILEALDLHPGETVGVTLDHGRLIVERQDRPHYSLEDLLSQCDFNESMTGEEQAWLEVRPQGGEL